MGSTIRGHLLLGGILLLWVALWSQQGLRSHAVEESLSEDMSAMHRSELSPDSVPALARFVVDDSTQSLELRLRAISASVDSRLRDRIRIAAGPREDPQALLGFVLHPQLTEEFQQMCPNVPVEVAVLCDPRQWSQIKAQVHRALLEEMRLRPKYAAATRVGGNDVPLLVSEALCKMGEEGRLLAEALLEKNLTGPPGALGVMALGCAGDRHEEGVGRILERLLGVPGAVGMAAQLECASRVDCVQKESSRRAESPSEALADFVLGLEVREMP